MSEVVSDFNTGIITISDTFDRTATASAIDATPYLSAIDEEYVLSFIDLDRVTKFTTFTYSTIGQLSSRYLETEYRVSRNGTTWTEYMDLEPIIQNFPPFDPLDPMYIDIKFTRAGTKVDGDIRLLSYQLGGELLRNSTDEIVTIGASGSSTDSIIIKPPYTYKVFKITDIEVLTDAASSADFLIEYRYSQDNTRSWTNWEPLTKENISTTRINAVRFFNIEFQVTNLSSGPIKISDINMIGDFQNITTDYQKTNLMGIRECCQSTLIANSANSSNAGAYDENGVFIGNITGKLNSQTCPDDNDALKPMTGEEKASLFNPYQQSQAANLLSKLSNDATEVFGHKTQYFVTDPDEKGIDYSLHEFGLFNIVCEGELKVSVDDNQFPDNQITMNQFDLMLFDSFEVHITKEQFKTLFGAQRRPSKEDMIYFCDLNRLFIVDHAQQFRQFNNYAVYYKVVLKKYNKRANVKPKEGSIEDRIKQLTNNSTIDELMKVENDEDKKAVANKDQLQPLTRDPIRYTGTGVGDVIAINNIIQKDLIENSTTIVAKQYYDFSYALAGGVSSDKTIAVKYKNVSARFQVSDNLGLCFWFRINNYMPGETYNFFDYYDTDNSLGYKVNLLDDVVTVDLNGDSYTWTLDDAPGTNALVEDVWYCYVLNVDQRNRTMNQYVHKRNLHVDDEDDARYLSTTALASVYTDEQTITPVDFELESTTPQVLVSDMQMTNVRMFNRIIPLSEHNIILNQYVVTEDTKYLVFADNANLRLTLPNYPYNGLSYE